MLRFDLNLVKQSDKGYRLHGAAPCVSVFDEVILFT